MKKISLSLPFPNRRQFVFSVILVLFLLSIFYFLLPAPSASALEIIPPCGKTGNCSFKDLVTMGNNIINFLIYIFAPSFATLLFMWAGFIFMFHSDNPGERSRARGIFWNVVVGFVLALAAFLIIKLILLGLQADPSLYKDIRG